MTDQQTPQPAPVADNDPFAPAVAAAGGEVVHVSASGTKRSKPGEWPDGLKYPATARGPRPGLEQVHAALVHDYINNRKMIAEQTARRDSLRVGLAQAEEHIAEGGVHEAGILVAIAALPPEASAYLATPQDAPDLSFLTGGHVTPDEDPQPPLTNDLTTPYDPDAPAVQGV